uniref:Uncharacterized protein n=1 Tax=Mustela putorius furo TaxID=9669 RepID=M3XTK8_MUSPF
MRNVPSIGRRRPVPGGCWAPRGGLGRHGTPGPRRHVAAASSRPGRRVPWGLWCAALGVIPARGGSALGKQGQALHLEGPLCVRLSEV